MTWSLRESTMKPRPTSDTVLCAPERLRLGETVMAFSSGDTQQLKFLDSLQENLACTTKYLNVVHISFYMECGNCHMEVVKCYIRRRVDGKPANDQVGWFCRHCRRFFRT